MKQAITLPDHIFTLPYNEAKREILKQFEKEYVERLVDRHKGNVSSAGRTGLISLKTIARIKSNRTTK